MAKTYMTSTTSDTQGNPHTANEQVCLYAHAQVMSQSPLKPPALYLLLTTFP